MKLRYLLKYECRSCGMFEKSGVAETIQEAVECPKCHRNSDFVEGTIRRVQERKRSVPKTQKRIVND